MIPAPLLVYVSKTGNTRTFADYLSSKLSLHIDDFDADITNYDKIILGAYTWGNGKIPKDIKEFVIKNKDNFKGKKVYIFGSGYSIYPRFCGAVDGLAKIVTDCGADVQWKFKFEKRFIENEFQQDELDSLIKKLIG
jgi:flavodoxin I